MDRTLDEGSSDKSSGAGSGGGGSKNDDGKNNGKNNGNDQSPVVISPGAHKSHDNLGLGPVEPSTKGGDRGNDKGSKSKDGDGGGNYDKGSNS